MRQPKPDIKLQSLSSTYFARMSRFSSTRALPLPSNNIPHDSPLRYQDITANSNMHEGSPLLSPGSSISERLLSGRRQTQGDLHHLDHENKNLCYLILLTISIGGLQLAWTVELSNGSPYLVSLGLTKSLMALVWIAGPLTGALVQPYVGMLSDRCTSPWGKRTPFIVFGSATTIISLLALAWVREVIWGILGIWGANPESRGVKNCIICLAVILVYILDFSINTEAANSMASRIIGIGNIIGYLAGYVDLRRYMWFFGNTQFKILCVNASLALAFTVFISLSTIKERNPRLEGHTTSSKINLFSFFKAIIASIRRLPPLTRKVCKVQFFAWIGMFPQLFYSSSYIGDIYVQPYLEKNPHMSLTELDQLYEKATRVGNFALLIYAIISLATNMILPFFVASSNNSSRNCLAIPEFTLRRAWLISHLIFSACMFSAVIVRRLSAATTLIGILGISWAVSLWVPFAIISEEVSRRDSIRRALNRGACDLDSGSCHASKDDDQAGVILGIHNMAIAIPQIISTVESSIIFKFLQKPRGTPGDRSFGVVLAVGGLSTLIAAWLVSRMEDKIDFPNGSEDCTEEVDEPHVRRV